MSKHSNAVTAQMKLMQAELLNLREENEKLKEQQRHTENWFRLAKIQAGFDANEDFDVVFKQILRCAKSHNMKLSDNV